MTTKKDPLLGHHFGIEVQGQIKGLFTECSGLGSEHEVVEHKVVDDNGREFIQKVPGRIKWKNIELSRGITENIDVWNWRKMVEDGDVEGARRNGSIVMYDQKLNVVARWDFERAWPVSVSGPSLKSDSNSIGIEKMIIAHEGLTRKS